MLGNDSYKLDMQDDTEWHFYFILMIVYLFWCALKKYLALLGDIFVDCIA